MTSSSYEDDDGAVIEVKPEADGSLTVITQGPKGPIVGVAIPVGERADLAAAAWPRMSTDFDADSCLDDDWRVVDPAYLRSLIAKNRSAAVTAGGPDDG
jgi:hypothetical protein